MAKILIIGIDPKYLDFTDSASMVADDITPDVITAGLNDAKAALEQSGHPAEIAWIDLGETARDVVRAMLVTSTPDLVVIGAGIRMIASNTELFETLVNTVILEAPRVQFAFNSEPDNTLEAALRWL